MFLSFLVFIPQLSSYIYLIFPILGSLLIIFVLTSIYIYYQVKKWKKYSIKILNKKLLYKNTIQTIRTELYKPFVKYQYEVNNVIYVSSDIAFDDECIIEEVPLNFPYERENNPPSYKFLDEILTIKTAFVNPKKTNQSVLINKLSRNRKNYYFLMIMYGIILILFPVLMI